MAQTVKKLSRQRSDKGSRIYRSETNGFDSRKAKEKRYTQEEFAVCCNYADDSALRKRLRNGLDIDTVFEFCRYLDTDPKSFFNSLCEESIH